jgi:hypothetical protein
VPPAMARLLVQFQPLAPLEPRTSLPLYRDLVGALGVTAGAAAPAPATLPPAPAAVDQLHQLQRELGRLAASVHEHARILDGEIATLDALLAEHPPPQSGGDAGSDAGVSAEADANIDAGAAPETVR